MIADSIILIIIIGSSFSLYYFFYDKKYKKKNNVESLEFKVSLTAMNEIQLIKTILNKNSSKTIKRKALILLKRTNIHAYDKVLIRYDNIK